MHRDIRPYLEGYDLRSIGSVEGLVPMIRTQADFDVLFRFLTCGERLVQMRAADALDKVSARFPEFLDKHVRTLVEHLPLAIHKEHKWHLAQLIARAALDADQLEIAWAVLEHWARNPTEGKLVRVHALQALYDLQCRYPKAPYAEAFDAIVAALSGEEIPSIDARIRKLSKASGQGRQPAPSS